MVRMGKMALVFACVASPAREGTSRVIARTQADVPARVLLLFARCRIRTEWAAGSSPSRSGRGLAWQQGRRQLRRGMTENYDGSVGDDIARSSSVSTKRQNSRPVGTDELTQAARDRATALVAAYVPTPATEGDLRCIEERQLRHKAGSSSRSVGVPPSPCRHGFPQAFAFDPCGYKVSSGLFRLSCPLLVQAIDQLEDEGGIEDVNARLANDESLREDFMAVNLAHGQLRRRLVTPDKMRMVEEAIGREGADHFLDSGLTGVTPGKVRDAKCLHAHVADALMRGRDANAIGRSTLDLLEARGVPTAGGDRCSEQCNFRVEETADSWRYTPQKNKQKLQMRKVRRKRMKSPETKMELGKEKNVLLNAEGAVCTPL